MVARDESTRHLWPRPLNMELRGFRKDSAKASSISGSCAKNTEGDEKIVTEDDGEIEDGEVDEEDGEIQTAAEPEESVMKKRKLDATDGPRAHSEKNAEKLERMLSKFAKQKQRLMLMQKKWKQKRTSTSSDDYLRDYDDVNYSYCVKRKILERDDDSAE